MPPTVSVVIPVFNRPVAVRRAIESVLAQTFQDFEIIVVDDGSTDDTAASVSGVEDPRVMLIRHPCKRGGSAARNTGIKASSGLYIAFLDSDDEWLPLKLERQLQLFERSGDELGLVYSGSVWVFEDGSTETRIPKRHKDIVRALLTANVIGETSVGIVRRAALEAIGGFDENLPAAQEMDLWLRVCERFPIDFVPEALGRIAKGRDPHRITADIAATTAAREVFRRKHGDKMKQHGVLHLHLRESGWRYLREARDRLQARRCYLRAWASRPTAAITYVLLTLTYLPLSWLDRMAKLKHFANRMLGRA
jgi:glycosyltransferase involved in cell wall biosynthesis